MFQVMLVLSTRNLPSEEGVYIKPEALVSNIIASSFFSFAGAFQGRKYNPITPAPIRACVSCIYFNVAFAPKLPALITLFFIVSPFYFVAMGLPSILHPPYPGKYPKSPSRFPPASCASI